MQGTIIVIKFNFLHNTMIPSINAAR